jgi:hypothetical protein
VIECSCVDVGHTVRTGEVGDSVGQRTLIRPSGTFSHPSPLRYAEREKGVMFAIFPFAR